MRAALFTTLALGWLLPATATAQTRRAPEVLPFGAALGREFNPDLGSARRILEGRVRPRHPSVYPEMDAQLEGLEARQTVSDWVLWPGALLGVASMATGVGVAFLGTDEAAAVGGSLLVGGLIVLLSALLVSAGVRPTEDDVRQIFLPVHETYQGFDDWRPADPPTRRQP